MKLFWCRGINSEIFVSKLGVTTKFLPEFDILLSKKIATENFFEKHAPEIAAPIPEIFENWAHSWKKLGTFWETLRNAGWIQINRKFTTN